MTDVLLGAFSGNVFPPKGWPKNLPKWVCLAGKILVNLPRVFCPILDPPNAHIRQNPGITDNQYKEKSPIFVLRGFSTLQLKENTDAAKFEENTNAGSEQTRSPFYWLALVVSICH